jgi:MurNAc alpha-1-phosphate uridylyltransferase
MPASAMVLAAGLGTRMRAESKSRPKPLVQVQKRALIDHVLDRLAGAGVVNAVVNVHHFADLLEEHLTSRKRPRVAISDERKQLLGTGGGIAKALPLLGNAPFLLVNSDSLWIETVTSNLVRLARFFDRLRMDAALLLAAREEAHGYEGQGDYALDPGGALRRRTNRSAVRSRAARRVRTQRSVRSRRGGRPPHGDQTRRHLPACRDAGSAQRG